MGDGFVGVHGLRRPAGSPHPAFHPHREVGQREVDGDHQDRDDDLLIGIKSTALLFGERTPHMLAAFYAGATVLIAAAGFMAGGGIVFAIGIIAFAAHLAWQVIRIEIDDPSHCLMLFKSNREAGLVLFAAMLLDAAL